MMNIFKKMNKAMQSILATDKILKLDIEKQKKILTNLHPAEDLIDESFNQYLCQKKISPLQFLFANVIAFPVLLIEIMKKERKSIRDKIKQENAVCAADWLKQDILPESLYAEYNVIGFDSGQYSLMTLSDVLIIKKAWKRHPLSFYFILKNLLKMKQYRDIIETHNPRAIICSCEYSFTSSFLTYFCRGNNIVHINIMHGEKLFYIRDSFFHFDIFYIWHEYYIDLFNRLCAGNNKYIVEIPKSLHLVNDSESQGHYTYYLGGENKKTILNIKKKLDEIGKEVHIRPHPRYSDLSLVKEVFLNYKIENTNEISINKSICDAEKLISLYSTVLFQGYINSKKIIIDDISDPKRFEELKKRSYILLNKDAHLLSKERGNFNG